MKKFTAMFLAIFTAVFMLSAVSFAEESADYAAKIGSTGYATLTDAIDNVKDGETVTLYADAAVGELTIQKKTVTIDLNGHNISSDAEWDAIYVIGGTCNLTNTSTNSSRISATGYNCIYTTANSNLNVNGNITLEGSERGIYCAGNTKVTLDGGVVVTGKTADGIDGDFNLTCDNAHISGASEYVAVKSNVSGNTMSFTDKSVLTNGVSISKNASVTLINTTPEKIGLAAESYLLVETETNADGSITYAYTEQENWSDHTEKYAVDETAKAITIANAGQLAKLAEVVNSGTSYAGYTVTLTNDIDLGGKNWTPIGKGDKLFSGKFDGNGKTIKNVKIGDSQAWGVGIFGYVGDENNNKCEIKNFTIENASIVGGIGVAVVAGDVFPGANISQINVKGDVSVSGDYYVGTIVGHGYVRIDNCKAESAAVSAKSTYAGGIAGWLGEGSSNITNCGIANVSVSGSDGVGGITGLLHYGNSIENCSVSKSEIKGTDADSTGSVVGYNGGTEAAPTSIKRISVDNVTGTENISGTVTADGETSVTTINITGEPTIFNKTFMLTDVKADDSTKAYRAFLTDIDSLKYKEVGFKFAVNVENPPAEANGKTTLYKNIYGTTVYAVTNINQAGSIQTFTPADFGTDSKYVVAFIYDWDQITKYNEYKIKSITYTPYAIKADGTVLEGNTETVTEG